MNLTGFKSLRNKCMTAISRFVCRDESGALTEFTMVSFIVILVGAGIGADYMRHEAYRAELQNALDRGTLAAAAFSQTEDPMIVVNEYVNNSRRWSSSVRPVVTVFRDPPDDSFFDEDISERSVRASASIDYTTHFLRLLPGIDNDDLRVAVSSGASQRQQRTEITLVLDISLSMEGNDLALGEPKITVLKREAQAFIDQLLTPETVESTSISIVPFGGHVNPGPFAIGMNLTEPTTVPLPAAEFSPLPVCPLFTDAEMSGAAASQIDYTVARPVKDIHHMYRSDQGGTGSIDWGWCPDADSAIVPLTNDATALKDAIENFKLYAGTGVDPAMKWASFLTSDNSSARIGLMAGGAALAGIDPDDEFALTGLVPARFSARPAPDSDPDTTKIIVFLTDGENTEQNDIDPRLYNGTLAELTANVTAAETDATHPFFELFRNMDEFNEFAEQVRAHIDEDNENMATYWARRNSSGENSIRGNSNNGVFFHNGSGQVRNTRTIRRSRGQALENVEFLCDDLHNRGVEVFTIGFNVPGLDDPDFAVPDSAATTINTGANRAGFVLGHCATNADSRYLASGGTLGSIFTDISNGIQNLRLTN